MAAYGSDECQDLRCDPCSENSTSRSAIKYCPVCDELLCQKCVNVHLRNKVLKSHPLNDNLSASFKRKGIHPLALCDKHKTEKIEQYCETHSVLCCDKCTFLTHKSCRIVAIKTKSQKGDQSIQLKDLLQMIRTLHRNVQRINANHENCIKSLNINRAKCFTEVKALKKELDELFLKLEKKVIDEVVETEASLKSKIDVQRAEGKHLLQQLSECKGILEDCESARDEELMFICIDKSKDDIEKMNKLVAELQDNTISSDLQFEAHQDVKNIRNILSLGNVKSGESMGHTIQTTAGRYSAIIRGVAVTSQRVLKVNSSCIAGSTFLESGELVLCDEDNDKLLLFNPDLTFKELLRLPGNPRCVTAITERRVVVTMPNKEQLYFVDMTPTIKVAKKKMIRYGMDKTTGKSQIYVLVHSGQSEIIVVGHDGRHLRTINLSAVGIKSPNDIVLNKREDRLFVSDGKRHGTNSVTCFESESCTRLFRYISDSLDSPSGLYLDCNDNLLICGQDSNNITVVTAEGRHERILVSGKDGVTHPETVSYRPRDGTLIVGMAYTSQACRVFEVQVKGVSHEQ